jgi:uncharacterized RDD family membrane protein YckC
MPFCEYCGREISPVATTCPQCGHPQRGSSQPVAVAVPHQELSGWWRRAAAALVDGVVLGVFGAAILVPLSLSKPTIDDPALGFSLVAVFVGVIAYRIVLEGRPRGQTLGKLALGIAVRDEATQGSIGYVRAFVRWAVSTGAWALFYLPGLIDVLFPLWDARNQTLHDKAARSIVIRV